MCGSDGETGCDVLGRDWQQLTGPFPPAAAAPGKWLPRGNLQYVLGGAAMGSFLKGFPEGRALSYELSQEPSEGQ